MLKKEKKTHQSPSSKIKADEERKNWLGFFFFFFSDCEYRGLEFWGQQVGNDTSANESVSKKTKKKKNKK